jgi:hypothetical protein
MNRFSEPVQGRRVKGFEAGSPGVIRSSHERPLGHPGHGLAEPREGSMSAAAVASADTAIIEEHAMFRDGPQPI